MRVKRERRKPIVCPYCQTPMVCMNRFEPISTLTRGLYVWYVCPRRKGEGGCGYSALLQVSPRTKRPGKTVFAVKLRKIQKNREGRP